jgi:hypothetical protein
MWARVVEFMLALWLAISPLFFGHALWKNALSCGFLIGSFALLSFHSKLPKLHLLNLPVALWLLICAGKSGEFPLSPFLQNYIVLGLLFGMLGIIPSDSEKPPATWRKFLKKPR